MPQQSLCEILFTLPFIESARQAPDLMERRKVGSNFNSLESLISLNLKSDMPSLLCPVTGARPHAFAAHSEGVPAAFLIISNCSSKRRFWCRRSYRRRQIVKLGLKYNRHYGGHRTAAIMLKIKISCYLSLLSGSILKRVLSFWM